MEYINREQAYANRGGCIFQSHRLPKWAKDDPKKFFRAADKYEGKGNRRYLEIEFALPNELHTVEQYRQIIDPFIQKHLHDHYYSFAIHEKIGALSNGQRHPHVHIMFSERLIDDVEKKKERAACHFFQYPMRKNIAATFEDRRKHGATKNRKWSDKSFLSVLRADFALIQNEVLAKNGFSIRVDHRSLKAQKEEAERNGDFFLARLFNRVPEHYIGVISGKDEDDPQLARLHDFRSLCHKHFDLILRLDSLFHKKNELETKDAVQLSSTNAKNFIDSAEYQSQKFETPELQALHAKLLSAVNEVNKWKRVIISFHVAQEQAMSEYMTKSEREIWQQYHESLAQKKRLEDFLLSLKKPDETKKDALRAYDDVVAGVNKKISALFSSAAILENSVAKIQRNLDSPDFKKNIQLVIHKILQDNLFAKQMLRKASDDLNNIVDELHNAIVSQTLNSDNQNILQTRDGYNIIRRQYSSIKNDYKKSIDLKLDLQKRIISPQRATSLAQNIFVNGSLKKLRLDLRLCKKAEQRFLLYLSNFQSRQKIFLNRDWADDERNFFLLEKYSLDKENILLTLEKKRIDDLKLSLELKQKELVAILQNPDAQEKVQTIAAGILRKNLKFVRRLETAEYRTSQLSKRLKHVKKQLDALKSCLSAEKRSTYYKVNEPNRSIDSAASTIADALLNDPQAVQLDKDELFHKKIYREL